MFMHLGDGAMKGEVFVWVEQCFSEIPNWTFKLVIM